MKKFEFFKRIPTPKVEIPEKKLIPIKRQSETITAAVDTARVKQAETELKNAHLLSPQPPTK